MTLLGPTQTRELASRIGIRPTKARGQNFVVDPGTIRRIVRLAQVTPGEQVVEVGPGLGSLTLGLLEAGAVVVAVELDRRLAAQLAGTVAELAPQWSDRLRVVAADALAVTDPGGSALVANLPYNVGVPVLLHALASWHSVRRALVMLQAEVAQRLVAEPGSPAYGGPSAKLAWYAQARRAGAVRRGVFWPVPRVDSELISITRRPPPATSATREETFAVVDAAFATRRKALRGALVPLAGSADAAAAALQAAGIDPMTRGERLGIADFARLAEEFRQRSATGP